MNRINPALFSAVFTAWVRETWPDRPDLIAIDGKTSHRSHDRADNKAPLHLVSAFAATSRLVLGQEAVDGEANEFSAIPVLIELLAAGGVLNGALVSIDANAKIAQAIKDKGGDYLLAVKANQPTLCAEIDSAFGAAREIDTFVDHDKGHGRIEQRSVSVIKELDWLDGERRFPGELRLPHAATIIRVQSQAETGLRILEFTIAEAPRGAVVVADALPHLVRPPHPRSHHLQLQQHLIPALWRARQIRASAQVSRRLWDMRVASLRSKSRSLDASLAGLSLDRPTLYRRARQV